MAENIILEINELAREVREMRYRCGPALQKMINGFFERKY
jgi:hypothetical protein